MPRWEPRLLLANQWIIWRSDAVHLNGVAGGLGEIRTLFFVVVVVVVVFLFFFNGFSLFVIGRYRSYFHNEIDTIRTMQVLWLLSTFFQRYDLHCRRHFLIVFFAISKVDGGYTSWEDWLDCSFSCGGGKRRRFRKCTNPVPQYGGKDCSSLGPSVETDDCNTNLCPGICLI